MTLGPHPKPWPNGPQYDVNLLEEGDTRNVVDKYRYWSREAILADLDQSRHSFHIAIENEEFWPTRQHTLLTGGYAQKCDF